MILFANAKINLGLFVTEKRSDGYHEIETIFYPVQLYDVLEIINHDHLAFETLGLDIPGNGDNLCVQAYNLLKADFEIPAFKINLLKNIPIGAGLGGGSSDAAYVLKGINEMQNLGLSIDKLKSYAEKLGADCPFFVENKPVYASGIGTTFENIELDLSEYFIVVIKPDVHISTKEAYENMVPQPATINLKDAIKLPIQEWKYYLKNDFETAMCEKYPIIQEIKLELYEAGALYASMSGSGSSVFGIFNNPINLDYLSKLGRVYYPANI